MPPFLETLFLPSYPPKGSCFLWQPNIVWLNVIGESVIALAFFSIPLLLTPTMRRYPSQRGISALFSGFCLLSGTDHLLSATDIWHPLYYLGALIKVLTVCAALSAAILLLPLLPRMMKALDRFAPPEERDDAALGALISEMDGSAGRPSS